MMMDANHTPPVFIDTNILLAATDLGRPHHGACKTLLERFMGGQEAAFISGQILREYAVVATRPEEQNGLQLSPNAVADNLNTFSSFLFFADESQAVASRFLELIEQFQLKGKRIHDANIAATMMTHGISRIHTYNAADYAPFSNIECITPK